MQLITLKHCNLTSLPINVNSCPCISKYVTLDSCVVLRTPSPSPAPRPSHPALHGPFGADEPMGPSAPSAPPRAPPGPRGAPAPPPPRGRRGGGGGGGVRACRWRRL